MTSSIGDSSKDFRLRKVNHAEGFDSNCVPLPFVAGQSAVRESDRLRYCRFYDGA